MFVGHAALAFAAKARVPGASLTLFLVATYLLDMLWPVFLLAGVEHVRIEPGNTAFTPLAFDSYPWSHSLVMAVAWGSVAGIVTFLLRRNVVEAALVDALVGSHWFLDVVTHRPDLPLFPWASTSRFGFGLWNSVNATLVVEGAMFLVAILLYLRATRSASRGGGTVGLWALVGFLLFAWASGPFSPPPPSEQAIAIVGIAFSALVIPWTMWIDRSRPAREPSRA